MISQLAFFFTQGFHEWTWEWKFDYVFVWFSYCKCISTCFFNFIVSELEMTTNIVINQHFISILQMKLTKSRALMIAIL